MLLSHVCKMSSCSEDTILSSIPPFDMQESSFAPAEVLAQHKRLYTEGMIKVLFQSSAYLNSAVPFLNHPLMSTANVPYLPYTCPHFCVLPPPPTPPSFFFTAPDYISRQDEVIVFLTPLKLNCTRERGNLFEKGDLCQGG